MKRLIIIAATLLTLTGVSAITATVSSASVCQPNGTGCTKAGVYPGPNTVINSNFLGVKVVWTKSVVQPYSSGVPLYWTAYMTYTNITSASITLGCPGNWPNASYVSEHMSGGSGNDGTVSAESTTCSQNPSLTVPMPPGSTYTLSATFHNVPWPGSAVAVTWGNAGTAPNVYPFKSGPVSSSCPSPGASEPSVIKQPNWAGYSIHRTSGGCMTEVVGTWTVPSVSCPLIDLTSHRVAVWAGLWGEGNPNVKGFTDSAWLPQIGVTSQCLGGLAFYVADWEMETNVTGGGALTCGDCHNTAPIGHGIQYLCNPDWVSFIQTHFFCNKNYPQFAVRAGDKITAYVTYNGTITSGPNTGDLDFDLALVNNTLAPGTNAEASFSDVITTMPVNLAQILGQGGLIVENNSLTLALAKFSSPIPLQLTSWNATGSGAYGVSQWQM
jgi:hypothetical protein